MTTPAASLVVPVRDEAGNIAPLVAEIHTSLDAQYKARFPGVDVDIQF